MHTPTALITGANGNLGTAIVRRLRRESYTLVGPLQPGSANPWEGEPGIDLSPLNLFNEAETLEWVQQKLAAYPHLDLAVLTVGGFSMGTVADTPAAAIQKMIDLNFYTAYHVVRALLPHWTARPGGTIVLVGAKPALEPQAGKSLVAYTLSKSLIFQLAELINATDPKIRASVLIPSIIDTPPNREAMPQADHSAWVKPEAIADMVAYLVSESGKALRQEQIKLYGAV